MNNIFIIHELLSPFKRTGLTQYLFHSAQYLILSSTIYYMTTPPISDPALKKFTTSPEKINLPIPASDYAELKYICHAWVQWPVFESIAVHYEIIYIDWMNELMFNNVHLFINMSWFLVILIVYEAITRGFATLIYWW